GYVEIRTGVRADQAVLTVRNTGPVVPAGDVERLLQPFQRLGTERVGTGAGLGLSIVAAIADTHGATLRTLPQPTGGLCIEVGFAVPSGGVVEDEAQGDPLTRPDRRHAVAHGGGRPAAGRGHRAVAGREDQPVPVRDEAGVPSGLGPRGLLDPHELADLVGDAPAAVVHHDPPRANACAPPIP